MDSDRAAWYFRQVFLGFQVMADRSPDDRLQYRIGWMLFHGVGTERDEAAALPWLEKAAQGGNPFGKYQLGKLLLSGTDTVPKDVERALELLTECAETGNQYAQFFWTGCTAPSSPPPPRSYTTWAAFSRSSARSPWPGYKRL